MIPAVSAKVKQKHGARLRSTFNGPIVSQAWPDLNGASADRDLAVSTTILKSVNY